MKILKFFGWTLLGLFVLFLVLIIIMAVFDYTTDDTEVKAIEQTTEPMTQDTVSLFTVYLQSEDGKGILEDLLQKANDVDIVLLQNGEEALNKRMDAFLKNRNLYFSFSKRSPVSFSKNGPVSFMDFSGLYTVSNFSPESVQKMLLPTNSNWINSLLSPTPSLQIVEYQNKGKRLYVLNLDNNMNGQMETQEMNTTRLNYIKTSIIESLPPEAYFVIAGNWENSLPGQSIDMEDDKANEIPIDWTKSGWQWIYDTEDPGGYGVLVSSNVQIKEIKWIETPSEKMPKAISLLFCLQ